MALFERRCIRRLIQIDLSSWGYEGSLILDSFTEILRCAQNDKALVSSLRSEWKFIMNFSNRLVILRLRRISYIGAPLQRFFAALRMTKPWNLRCAQNDKFIMNFSNRLVILRLRRISDIGLPYRDSSLRSEWQSLEIFAALRMTNL